MFEATIREPTKLTAPLWVGELLDGRWDGGVGVFVIRGRSDAQCQMEVEKCVTDRTTLALELRDHESTRLAWRGRVTTAFARPEPGKMECCLTMFFEEPRDQNPEGPPFAASAIPVRDAAAIH